MSSSEQPSPDAITIERTFDAPASHIWQMWTNPSHFEAWYGPDGVSIHVATMDVRVGGTRLVQMEMTTPDGPMQMWFVGEHLKVVENKLLVYTESVSDENGSVASPSLVTEVKIELVEVGDKTKMVMTHIGVPADSPGAVGWEMALAKLDAYVASA